MVSSFRLSQSDERLLELAAKRSGKSRSQIVREAVQMYCKTLAAQPKRSLYDRLLESDFQPVDGLYPNLSSDKKLQRRLIGESFRKASR